MPSRDRKHPIDYSDRKVRREILIRQRRGLWTPEQVESLAGHFRLKPGLRFLDCGCGLGYSLRTWGRYCLPGGKLTGIDRDEQLLKDAKRSVARDGLGKATSFVRGDICAMPFEDGSFDVAIAHVVFCHLSKPERALDEMLRVVKPGGCVAVFDNAIGGGAVSSWNNLRAVPMRDRVFYFEAQQRILRGRTKLGHGDFGVGCYLPSWMEARGMRDVDVRANEKVSWLAPPYHSPAQRTEYRNLRERLADNVDRRPEDSTIEELRKGGADERMVRSYRRRASRGVNHFKRAFKQKTLAYAWAGQFWCVWGFKR